MGQLGRGRAVRSRFLQNLRLDDGRVEVKVVVEVVGRPRYPNQCRTPKKEEFSKVRGGASFVTGTRSRRRVKKDVFEDLDDGRGEEGRRGSW
jgi:hypothetical protein